MLCYTLPFFFRCPTSLLPSNEFRCLRQKASILRWTHGPYNHSRLLWFEDVPLLIESWLRSPCMGQNKQSRYKREKNHGSNPYTLRPLCDKKERLFCIWCQTAPIFWFLFSWTSIMLSQQVRSRLIKEKPAQFLTMHTPLILHCILFLFYFDDFFFSFFLGDNLQVNYVRHTAMC